MKIASLTFIALFAFLAVGSALEQNHDSELDEKEQTVRRMQGGGLAALAGLLPGPGSTSIGDTLDMEISKIKAEGKTLRAASKAIKQQISTATAMGDTAAVDKLQIELDKVKTNMTANKIMKKAVADVQATMANAEAEVSSALINREGPGIIGGGGRGLGDEKEQSVRRMQAQLADLAAILNALNEQQSKTKAATKIIKSMRGTLAEQLSAATAMGDTAAIGTLQSELDNVTAGLKMTKTMKKAVKESKDILENAQSEVEALFSPIGGGGGRGLRGE